jgi:hypothetical protein
MTTRDRDAPKSRRVRRFTAFHSLSPRLRPSQRSTMSGVQKKASQGDMKQKSLMGWFGGAGKSAPSTPSGSAKTKAGASSKAAPAKPKAAAVKASSSKTSLAAESTVIGDSDSDGAPVPQFKTPKTPKTPQTPARAQEVPPSSSPPEVDMQSSDIEAERSVPVSISLFEYIFFSHIHQNTSKTPSKRKISDDASDEEILMKRAPRTG